MKTRGLKHPESFEAQLCTPCCRYHHIKPPFITAPVFFFSSRLNIESVSQPDSRSFLYTQSKPRLPRHERAPTALRANTVPNQRVERCSAVFMPIDKLGFAEMGMHDNYLATTGRRLSNRWCAGD